jgi:hypothetical protein
MKRDLQEVLSQVYTGDWKRIPLEYGPETLEIKIPRDSVEISMGSVPSIESWGEEIERAFSNPIGSPRLEEIIAKKGKPRREGPLSALKIPTGRKISDFKIFRNSMKTGEIFRFELWKKISTSVEN